MKNVYITRGTAEFMEKIKKKNPGEKMILMHGNGGSQLLHETEDKTVFQTPNRYEVVAEVGQLQEHGFFALNNISISDEGKPIFEDRFKREHPAMESTPGFIAFRLLRPIGSDTYILLSEWDDSKSFDLYKHNPAFEAAYDSTRKDIVAGPAFHIFTSAPYLTFYSSLHNQDNE
ncbi:antibiotic biosynthesis monooxygenase [Sporosarcina sp. BI001-red]|uniref:antibiotic biosynthesis monooxygenase family protein n=1 Tax=Sporosarcina sp. BI001-red TaxID=2282866 RepID=UPI000E266676|nr:antibiotic biosynthesis monooxygenase [Sporosarcina sp. BI001-red]REB08833.1 antibiotic biosynthesis monooxygenase [Sporosarcina sp. BI001-red]